ncbi:hypothetical protein B9Z19DRAFT_1012170, partial [Tuber borchii]
FSYHFIHFFTSNSLQMSLFTILLEGALLSHNPRVRKSAFKSFHYFLIQPQDSLPNTSSLRRYTGGEKIFGR